MKTTRRPLRRARRALLLASLLSACITVLMLWVPAFAVQLLEGAVPAGSVALLATLVGVAAAVVLVTAVLDFCRELVLLRAALWLDHTQGAATIERGLADGCSGDVLRARAAAVARVRTGLGDGTIATVLELPWAVAACGLVYVLHPVLALACATALAAMALIHLALGADGRPAAAGRESERWLEAAARDARMITAAGMAAAVARRWELVHRRHVSMAYRHGLRRGLASAALRAVATAGLVGIMATAGYLAIAHEIAMASAVATVLIAARTLKVCEHAACHWHDVQDLKAAWRELSSAEASRAAMAQAGSDYNDAAGTGRIVLDSVACGYPGALQPAIGIVSLVIEPGECIGIIGPPGSGKSLLAATFAGVLAPAAGRVLIDGRPLERELGAASGNPVGYLADMPRLLPGSVADNICGFAGAAASEVAHAALRAGVHEMLAALPHGYDTPVGEDGRGLSLRQQRAVALARAFFGARRLLVLDEPELALDETGLRHLATAIEVAGRAGIGRMIVTSDQRLLRLTDRVIVMSTGRIEAVVPSRQLVELATSRMRPAA